MSDSSRNIKEVNVAKEQFLKQGRGKRGQRANKVIGWTHYVGHGKSENRGCHSACNGTGPTTF